MTNEKYNCLFGVIEVLINFIVTLFPWTSGGNKNKLTASSCTKPYINTELQIFATLFPRPARRTRWGGRGRGAPPPIKLKKKNHRRPPDNAARHRALSDGNLTPKMTVSVWRASRDPPPGTAPAGREVLLYKAATRPAHLRCRLWGPRRIFGQESNLFLNRKMYASSARFYGSATFYSIARILLDVRRSVGDVGGRAVGRFKPFKKNSL